MEWDGMPGRPDKLSGIKPGDRVRVTFEGAVKSLTDGGVYLERDNVEADASWWGPRACAAPCFQIERIEPPLKVGDRVKGGSYRPGTVTGIDGEFVWVRHDTGAHQTFYVADLERIA